MMTTQQSERAAFEKMDIESLEKFVNETVSTMAASASLQPNEALDILENIQVEMVGELRDAVSALGNDKEAVKRVDPEKLSWEIEKAIEAISVATDLNTDEITTIFSNKPGASLADVSYRLHVQSGHDRVSF
jgi:uncharacterized protein (UPF0264 family)